MGVPMTRLNLLGNGAATKHDPEKWGPVFGKITLNQTLERDGYSRKSQPAPGAAGVDTPRDAGFLAREIAEAIER